MPILPNPLPPRRTPIHRSPAPNTKRGMVECVMQRLMLPPPRCGLRLQSTCLKAHEFLVLSYEIRNFGTNVNAKNHRDKHCFSGRVWPRMQLQ